MADLHVLLLGHNFKNPIIAASGIYGYGHEYENFFPLLKLSGFACKATTLNKRNGNDGIRTTEISNGVLFSVGLQNCGIDEYIKYHLPNLLDKETNILTNIAGSNMEEYVSIIEKLEQTNAPIIELNISCPNVSMGGTSLSTDIKATEKITSLIRNRTKKLMTVKLAPNVGNIADIAKVAESSGADAISLINSMPGMKINLYSKRPLFRNNTAGISGNILFPLAVRMVWQVSCSVKIPVLGIGGNKYR